MRAILAIALSLLASAAIAQPGPGPQPDPWVINGNSISYPGGVVIGTPTGGSQGAGTLNVSGGFYINGAAVEAITSATPPLVYNTGVISLGYNSTLAVASNNLGVNLAHANTWTAQQTFSATTTFSAAITYGGTTLANSATGSGSMVLGTAPTINNVALLGSPSGPGSIISINSVNCQIGGACTIGASQLIPGTTTVSGGTTNGLFYCCAAGSTLGNLATAASGVLITDGSGVPSISSTLPIGIAATNMTLTTPSLGVATATSINGLTITTSTGTLTIANGKVLTANNSITFAGTDTTTMTFPAASATVAGLATTQTFSGTDTFSGILNVTGTFEIGGTSVAVPISLANGGTAASLTASNGGIVYSTATGLAVLAGTVTASQCLLSGASTAPIWGSCSGAAAVSSVSNSDSTLTISPTSGSVVASLNLGNPNTWTGVQTFTNGDLKLKGSSSGAMTLEAPAIASTYIITFPATTDKVAVLGTAQTFTAVQTITNSDLCLLGSSTGCTTFFSANASASNYTLTFPAITSTVAVLDTINQTFTATETFSGTLNVSGTLQLGGNAFSTNAALAVSAGTTGQLAYWSSGTAMGGASLGTGLSLSGSTINTPWTISSTNIYNNNAGTTKITGAATNFFYPSDGAVLNKFNDRFFVGGATVNSGNIFDNTDWLSTLEAAYQGVSYDGPTFGATAAILQAASQGNTYALVVGAQSLNNGPGGAVIPLGVFGYNNSSTTTDGWGLYIESHRQNSTVVNTYGAEIAVINLGNFVVVDPYSGPSGVTIAMQLDSGGGGTPTGHTTASAGLLFQSNPDGFGCGICFQLGSVTAYNSIYHAINFPAGYQMVWFYGAGNAVGEIWMDQFGNLQLNPAGGITLKGTATVNCSGPPTGSFLVVNGLVLHC